MERKDDVLFAGAAARDISPRKPLFLFGYPHVERISTGIHDPLLATALALRTPERRLIMVALDILFIDRATSDAVRSAIAERTGVPAQNILISCTHTHSGPLTIDMLSCRADPVVPRPDPQYMEHFRNAIIEAAVEACAQARPAELAQTSAIVEGVRGNRIDPAGAHDPEIGILAIRSADDQKLIALSLTYALHPTVLHEDSTLVSGDFPYFAKQYLRERLGDELHVLYHLGCAGDQSPRHWVRAQTFAEARRLGEWIGGAAHQSIARLEEKDYSTQARLDAMVGRVDLVPRALPPLAEAEQTMHEARQRYETLKRDNAPHGPLRTAECAMFGAEELVTLARFQANDTIAQMLPSLTPAEVQVLAIAGHCIVGLPGELFVEYGLQIKKHAPCPVTVVSLAGGELQGYIATPEAEAIGSYEANNSLFAPESGRRMAEAALRLMRQLGAKESSR